MIHSTAVIDPRAHLEAGVEIGPNVVIEGPARIGANTKIQAGAIITGQVTVGSGNIIGYGSVIGGLPQDLSFRPDTLSGVQIGDDNVLREHCTIHRGTKPESFTVLGSRCLLMVGAHLGHNSRVGDQVVLANNVLLAGYVEVEEKAFLGGGSLVHQYTRLGRMAIMQGGSGIGKDLPPFAVAAGRNSVVGINVIGLRRAGFGGDLRAEVKQAFSILYHEGLTISQALDRASGLKWSPEVEPFWEFVRTSKRGICLFARWSEIKSGSNIGEA
ncbi:MAG: acyl-ACP--UDP-N-acetylglucosamine O-acyltransferase [Verrucomicrobia bacterium]|jgi:UDP-N-acetylglucosamine acyltransferase|nr:acyl-ACP--UDP-N-acetylglucosamine O-acyltransferase [Verrucomicrobiota bacterium]